RHLMQKYSLSQRTIMQAISQLEKEGLVERRSKSGIFAGNIPSKYSAVAFLSHFPISRTISRVLIGIQSILRERQKALLLVSIDEGHYDETERILENNRIRNIIVEPISANIENIAFIDFFRRLSQKGYKIVTMEHPIPGITSSFVGETNSASFKSMTEIFIRQGIKEIVVAGKLGSRIYNARLDGIREAIKGKNIELIQLELDNKDTISQKARRIIDKAKRGKAIILADASTATEISYELRLLLPGNELNDYRIGGIIEPGSTWPLPPDHSIWLEKLSEEMGQTAATLIDAETPQVRILNMILKGFF
ncbi:MAG: GntR family transcriptional regulator, partial [Victivallales bacterium]|nr:GntR family transcriptional regulator [Victivallales bacterium]